MIKISVIVAVYNTEPFIGRCVKSLMEQTIADGIEFIFIDDCSQDKSLEILQNTVSEYPDRVNSVVIVTHSKNMGVAATKAEGIRLAKGDFVGWCDSDDWCEKDMYSILISKAYEIGVDIVACNHIEEKGSLHILKESLFSEQKEDILDYLYQKNHYFLPLCDTLIRRSLLCNHDIYPYDGVNIAEDVNVCIRAFYYADRIAKVPDYLYHYNKDNPISITTTEYNDLSSRWQQNKKNTDAICAFLLSKDASRFAVTCNYLKFSMKAHNAAAFSSLKEYYYTYPESHKDILKYSATSLPNRIKIWLVYRNYFIFRLYHLLKG